MHALVMLLTDENPEIRLFMINQNLAQLFHQSKSLEVSPRFMQTDSNDHQALSHLFHYLGN